MRCIPVLLSAVVLVACSPKPGPERTATAHPLVQDFKQRVDSYMQLREEAGRGLLPLATEMSPGEVIATQKTLAARIRERRAGAAHGDIFTPDIRVHFRELMAGPLTGPREEAIRALLKEDAPDPDAVPLEVNAIYPTGQPYATTPPSVLALLPSLPDGLEYRILGRDLVLLDQAANLIVDYMRNAVPRKEP